MVYGNEEKAKMTQLLDAFQSFIQEQSYFDIVYVSELARVCNISRTTAYKYINLLES